MRGLTAWPVARVVQWAIKHPLVTLAVSVALAVVSAIYAAHAFNMTSDTAALISEKVAWRQREKAFQAAFPHNGDATVIVIDGATPELAESAASRLAAALEPQKDFFLSVERPDGGPFFGREALLYLSAPEVEATTAQLITAQPFLGALAADPSLRGVMDAVSAIAQGVTNGDTDLAKVDKPIAALGTTLSAVAAGKTPYFSWQKMIASDGNGGLKSPTRRFVIVHGRLGYDELMPGAESSEQIRATARTLALDAAHGVSVRLTGSVPLSDEEFASLQDRAWLVTSVMLAAVLVMLWLAVRSKRLVAAILVTTIIGLILTAAVGLAVVGRFNLISVAFVPLFVGLGVDFGIQYSVRFRAERRVHKDTRTALLAAAIGIGGSLALAAAAIVLGFLAFLPTDYIGVSELGIISGLGMAMGFFLNISLLPALIVLMRPRRRTGPVGAARMAPLDRFLVERRRLVLWAFGLSTLVGVALLPLVRFDFNPLHLKDPHKESMATLLDIERDPQHSPYTIDVLRPNLPAVDQLAARLAKLPEVSQTVTLSSFVPDDQARKLAAISDADLLLDPTLNPFEVKPPPTDAEVAAAMRDAAVKLQTAAGSGTSAPAAHARELAAALNTLANGPPAGRAHATAALIPPLNVMLDQIRTLLLAQPVTLQTLPPNIVRNWIAKDGRARVEVSPRGNSTDNATLVRFSKAVLKVAPDATGAPISIQEAGGTISRAFIEAGLLSLVAISGLLILVLRSVREVAFTLAPIVVAGFLTLATCVLINQPINFANIIAFPLLFGVGVAFHIYFVMAWRKGSTNLLQSSLARGVFFSALTTGTAFGSLIFSSHPGTASMGKILMISLIWTLVAALIFEPALLGPPLKAKQRPCT